MRRNILIVLVLLLVFIGVGRAIEAPEITSPDDGEIKNQDFNLTWDAIEGAECYVVEENGDFEDQLWGEQNTRIIINVGEKQDGEYSYIVESTTDDEYCSPENASDPVTVTIDTTDPSLISRNPGPGDDRVDIDLDEIVMEFDGGESKINQSYTAGEFNTDISGNLEWTEDETLTFNVDETLEYSTEYSVSVEAKDRAGNTNYFSWSFETDTPAEDIDIRRPDEGEKFIVGGEIPLRADVYDSEGEEVKGGTLDVSGISGCFTTLDFEGDGRFEGSCSPGDTGEQTLQFTAEAAGKSVSDSKTVTVLSEPDIDIEIIEPDTEQNYTRGEEIQFEIETWMDGEPFDADEAKLRPEEDPSIDFTTTDGGHTWETTHETTYQSPRTKQYIIEAEGEARGTKVIAEEEIYVTLEPVELDLDISYHDEETGEKYETLEDRDKLGEDIVIRAEVTYPDGTKVKELDEEGEIEGTLEIWEEGENETDKTHLTFKQTPEDGVYESEQSHRIGSDEYEFIATVEAEDEHENSGKAEKMVEGPGDRLTFAELTRPHPRAASPGQNLTIRGYVEGPDGEILTEPKITVNNKEMEVAADDHYEINYKIPEDEEVGEEYLLDFTIEHGEAIYSDERTLDLEAPVINLDEEKLEERGIEKNEKITAEILYPNGDPVRTGEYHLEIGEQDYSLTYNPEIGVWESEEIDLGRDEQTLTVTVAGETAGVEAETASKTGVTYKWSPTTTEWLIATPVAIAGIIAGIIAAIVGSWYYFKRYKYIKQFEEKINKLKETFIKMDNAYRAYAKTHDSEKLNSRQGDIKSKQKSIREEIKELTEKQPFLKKKQEKQAKEIIEKATKKALSFYPPSMPGKRAWLTGLTNFKANKLYTETKDKYADKVKTMKKEMEEDKEKIKQKLIEKHGFNKNTAKGIIKFQEKRQKRIQKIKKQLKQGKKAPEIKENIKKQIKTGDKKFQEYRAKQLIKKAGGKIKPEEPEPEPEEEEKEFKSGTHEKTEKTKEKPEKREKYEPEINAEKALKELVQLLRNRGLSEEKIEKQIKKEAKTQGMKPGKVKEILEDIREE